MFFEQIINGLTIGCTYSLVAIGYTMVFGVLELINFANGSVYMFGGYLSLIMFNRLIDNFWLSFLLSIILTGFLGYGIYKLGLKRLYTKKAPKLSGLITTLGIATIIDNFVLIFFGSETKPYPNMLGNKRIMIGSASVGINQIVILIVAVVLMIVLSAVVYKTKFGKSMRAVAQNQVAARLMGIPVNTIVAVTFFISSALSAIAGTLVGMYYQSIDINMGFSIGIKTIASAVLGGVGVLPGAMLGGLLIGIFETIGASYISTGYRDAIAYAILILVILIKPTGLLGKEKVNKV